MFPLNVELRDDVAAVVLVQSASECLLAGGSGRGVPGEGVIGELRLLVHVDRTAVLTLPAALLTLLEVKGGIVDRDRTVLVLDCPSLAARRVAAEEIPFEPGRTEVLVDGAPLVRTRDWRRRTLLVAQNCPVFSTAPPDPVIGIAGELDTVGGGRVVVVVDVEDPPPPLPLMVTFDERRERHRHRSILPAQVSTIGLGRSRVRDGHAGRGAGDLDAGRIGGDRGAQG